MANSIRAVPTAVEALPGDTQAILFSLVSNLETYMFVPRPDSTHAPRDDPVLLDVDLGDMRLIVLRQRRPSPMSLLSPREQEIARMVAQGCANKTIASVLDISSWTVASHLRRIFMKLQVSSRAAMVTCLSEAGLNGLLARQDDEMTHPGVGASSGLARADTGVWPGSRRL